MEWISVKDRLPPEETDVLAAYKDSIGRWQQIRAEFIHPQSILAEDFYAEFAEYEPEYDEETDTYYVRSGWVERIANWGDYTSVEVCEGEVTHWMPLPAPPVTPE